MRFTIIFSLIFLQCTSTPSEDAAVGILWNEEPSASSSQIMVLSELKGENLTLELEKDLNGLGFYIADRFEDQIITQSRPIEEGVMRLIINIRDAAVIISGEKGEMENPSEGDWQVIERGKGDYASPEWELMKVLATSLNNIEVLYN